jgi:hypothetical protein
MESYGSPIIFTLMMGAIISSETPVLTRVTRRHITEDGILYSHRCEYLKYFIRNDCFAIDTDIT